MTRLQKFQILLQALAWVTLSVVIVLIGFPVGLVLVLLGGFFSVFHIGFMTNIAEKFLQSVTSSIHFITKQIEALTQRVESVKA